MVAVPDGRVAYDKLLDKHRIGMLKRRLRCRAGALTALRSPVVLFFAMLIGGIAGAVIWLDTVIAPEPEPGRFESTRNCHNET